MSDDDVIRIPVQLWHFFNERRWDEAKALLAEDFEGYWPQSIEKIVGRNNFIEVNRQHPGTHKIEILNTHFGLKER